MEPIVSTDIMLSHESTCLNNLQLRIRYSMSRDGTVILFGAYLFQKELTLTINTTNDVNILIWFTQETLNELQDTIRENYYAAQD